MKKTLFVSILFLGVFTACSSKEKGTHRHPDGRVHANHADSTKAAVDTTAHGHSHDEGDGHTHE
jgi:hypothetical protein